jgi:site-specific DNA-cytosine methylase
MAKSKINCLELFAGCGGLGYGFHKTGYNIIACNELEEKISKTYQHNFKGTEVIVGDITKDDIKDKIYKQFNNKKCDIVIGGPPCVAYSMSGKRDSRDKRGQLFNDYVEIVKKLKPKVFVMENVKGILTMKHDKPTLNKNEQKIADKFYILEKEKIKLLENKKLLSSKDKKKENNYQELVNKNKEDLKNITLKIKKMHSEIESIRENVTKIIEDAFDLLNYKVFKKLLNSADYGVSQKRQRVIFIGIQKSVINKNNNINEINLYPKITHFKDNNDNNYKWKTVKESIEYLKDKENDIESSHILTTHTVAFLEKIKNTKCGESVNPKYKEAFFRCKPDEPSNTVKENHGGVFIHYEKDRVMTPRELAELQSFPKDFIFKGSKSNILIQLGNAVPCLLSKAIAEQIKKTIFK